MFIVLGANVEEGYLQNFSESRKRGECLEVDFQKSEIIHDVSLAKSWDTHVRQGYTGLIQLPDVIVELIQCWKTLELSYKSKQEEDNIFQTVYSVSHNFCITENL